MSAPRAPAAGVDVVTLGCRLNALESERMAAEAAHIGVADTVIVNSCAVTAEAVRQSRQAIRRARRNRPSARILATGCAAEIDPDAFRAMPEVDVVIPNRQKTRPEFWARIARELPATAPSPPPPSRRARGYVEVQNGCDHRCTFCVIPFGRGSSRSTPVAETIRQVRTRWEEGYREVVLTGVDLTAYGPDLAEPVALGDLVAAILIGVLNSRAFGSRPSMRRKWIRASRTSSFPNHD